MFNTIKSRWIRIAQFTIAFGLFLTFLNSTPVFAQYQRLFIKWVGVIDNGEGDDKPHGPYGNLHLQLYDSQGKEYAHYILVGPSRNEFLDGDQASYWIYLGVSSTYIKIWESDPGGPFLGRSHDMLFEGWITNPGIWYSGYAAAADARRNALNRGANSWATKVWAGGIQPGIPKLFIKIVSQ